MKVSASRRGEVLSKCLYVEERITMGEAKRRKQRDLSYGQVYQVKTPEALERHVEKLFSYFYQQWYENLKATNANQEEVTQRLADGMQQQLSCYKAPDRQVLANALLTMYAEAGGDYLESSFKQDDASDQALVLLMLMECLIKVLEPWLNEDMKREANKMLAQLPS